MRERILLIDDDIAILRMLEIILSDLGYDIVTAKDGIEAPDRIAEIFGAHIPMSVPPIAASAQVSAP